MEFQLSYFKSSKMMLWKYCTQYASKLENSAVATGLEKVSFHSIPKRGSAKECSNYRTITLISDASKVMLKILQVRLQQYINCELSDVQAEIKLPTSAGSSKKHESSRKTSTSTLFGYAKDYDCVDHNKLWKILKEMEYQTTWPASWEICMQIRKQQLELDMEQQTNRFPNRERITSRLYIVIMLI